MYFDRFDYSCIPGFRSDDDIAIAKQRLEDEYDANVIITAPTVPYKGKPIGLLLYYYVRRLRCFAYSTSDLSRSDSSHQQSNRVP